MRRRTIFAIAASAWALACSPFSSSHDDPSIDGSSDIDGGSSIDGGGGSGIDGSLGVDGAASTLDCEGAIVCDGFERSDPSSGWSPTAPEGALTTTSLHARSGEMALSATLPMGENTLTAELVTKVSVSGSQLTLRYASFVDDTFVVQSINTSALRFEDDVEVSVKIRGATSQILLYAHVVSTDTYKELVTIGPLVKNRWADVRVDMDLGKNPITATLTYDGHTQSAEIAGAPPPASPPTLYFGLVFTSGEAPVTIFLDDLRLDMRP